MAETENEVLDNAGEQELSEVLRIRREKLDAMRAGGFDPYTKVKYDFTAYTADIVANFEAMEGKRVRIAGRMMSRRDMGKANFIDVADGKGRIQCYIRVNDVGEETGRAAARYLYMRSVWSCFRNHFCLCRRSTTACAIQT